jgi:hypothetical protein
MYLVRLWLPYMIRCFSVACALSQKDTNAGGLVAG